MNSFIVGASPRGLTPASAIFDYIESFYNRSRRHSSLGYQSPLDYESSLS